MEAISIIAV